VSPKVLVGGAAGLSILLAVVYLAAGGGSYEPTPVADPCQARAWTSPDGLEEIAQQFLLSSLDGAACELGVSREELAAALPTEQSRAAFAAEQGITDTQLAAAIRAGIGRAINDAEDAGAIPGLVADGLRAAAANLPVDEAIAVIADAQGFLGDAGGLLDQILP
jgi:hypothetical protein